MWGYKWMLVAALSWMGPATDGGATAEIDWRAPAGRFIQRLEAESGHTLRMRWNAEAGTPGMLEGRLSEPSGHTPEWISFEFMEKAKAAYGLKRVNENMRIARVEHSSSSSGSSSGSTTIHMQRFLYGKPVCGNELSVELDRSGIVRRVEGTIHADLERKRLHRPMIPAISSKQAAEVAAGHVQGASLSEAPHVHECYLPTRAGVPLVYIVSYPSVYPRSVTVHSLTGRVIDG